MLCVFFMQKTAYEMRISDWSSDVCSSDLHDQFRASVYQFAQIVRGQALRTDITGGQVADANLSDTVCFDLVQIFFHHQAVFCDAAVVHLFEDGGKLFQAGYRHLTAPGGDRKSTRLNSSH